MDSLFSSSESISGVREPGNLALCRTSDEANTNTSCLGIDAKEPSQDVMKSRVVDGESPLNWRYEDGLLRSVGPDGYATKLCLGPSTKVITLDGTSTSPYELVLDATSSTPYELVLQDCPENIPSQQENIFAHRNSREDETFQDETTVEDTTNTTTTTTTTSNRHMQFLVVGDGRIQSLAPVRDEETKAMLFDKPFCVTVMKWSDDEHTKAYLSQCVVSSDDAAKGQPIQQEQQLFDTSPGSSFEPFLFNWQNEEEGVLELAYQIGDDGYNPFDSYEIRVMNEDSAVVLETTVSKGSNTVGGLLSQRLSDFDEAGAMDAHLIGISRAGLDSSWLASTSFEVSEDAIESGFPNSYTWALVTFWSIMVFYVIIVKCNSIFCPMKNNYNQTKKKKQKRESELTAATIHEIPNVDSDWGGSGRSNRTVGENDGGREQQRTGVDDLVLTSEHRRILYRLTEEEIDPGDIEDHTSSNGSNGEPIINAASSAESFASDIEEP